jgi:ligand-binding sensor domain-containing protein/two-component sensor histidine kinase
MAGAIWFYALAGLVLGWVPRCMNQAGHDYSLELRQLSRRQDRGARLRRGALLGTWAAWFGLAGCSAVAATNGITPYGVRAWQTDDGLPQNSVYAITQSREGYLWVGTHEGLARFDGVRFAAPGENAPPELSHGWITALCAGRDGSLWIGCEGYGLGRLKEGKFTRFCEADGLLSNQIRCLLEGLDGALWIGSEGGLTRYREGKFSDFTEKNGLAANSVRGLCEDRQGNLRIATLRGLSRLDKEGTISTFNIKLGTPANALKFVCEDGQGRIWTGLNEGLNCVEGETITTYGVNEGLPDRIVTIALEDRSGQLWVGTYRGLTRMVNGRFVPRPNREGVFGDRIYTVFEDREGNIWAGAEDGLYLLNPARFTAYTTQQGLTRNNVMSVYEDRAGTIWIGTWGGGLNQMKGETITPYGPSGGPGQDQVLALEEGRDESLWVGMDHGGGLNRLKDGPKNLFARQPGLIDAAIRVIHEDRQGTLWIGTSRGLNTYKEGKFQTYTTANGLAGDTVWVLLEDDAGNMWIGTDGGVSRWQGGQFTNFTTRDGLSHNSVDALYEDREKVLWLGTKGGGVNRWKAGKFTACTTRQGLFSDEIYEIVEDDYGYFWMSCRKGIFRVNKKELENVNEGAGKAVSCTAFGRDDGLPSVQCNGVAKPAGWKGRDGRLWFPTIRGVVAVEPGIKTNERRPPVLIEEVMAGGRSLRPDGLAASDSLSLTVPPGRGGIEIHYTALSFQAPRKNRFKYLLEGVDPGWVEAGGRRSVSYNNLAPGKYRFRVVACNNDGVWNETGATLSLVLVPHYWQTWWFKLAIGAATALLLTLLYRSRVKRLREIERLRVEIAANLHDDVGARLTKVAMVTELVDRETTESHPNKPHIRNIFRTIREITQAMDEIVWTINPKNDTLDNLADYIFRYAQEYFQDTGVRCRLDVPAQLPDQPVSTETRHNLFMAVKEALNNALKHAEASEVRIGLEAMDGRMAITITDNGRGFSAGQAQSKGNGLENMNRRLAQIGGRFVLESEPGRGTRIRLEAAGG